MLGGLLLFIGIVVQDDGILMLHIALTGGGDSETFSVLGLAPVDPLLVVVVLSVSDIALSTDSIADAKSVG